MQPLRPAPDDCCLPMEGIHRCELSEDNFRHRRFKNWFLVQLFLSFFFTMGALAVVYLDSQQDLSSTREEWDYQFDRRTPKAAVLIAMSLLLVWALCHALAIRAVQKKWATVLSAYTIIMIVAWCLAGWELTIHKRGGFNICVISLLIYLSNKNVVAMKTCPDCY
ncbi:unnamed protein product, partial [Mesorhabditis spiculigera]